MKPYLAISKIRTAMYLTEDIKHMSTTERTEWHNECVALSKRLYEELADTINDKGPLWLYTWLKNAERLDNWILDAYK